MNNIRKYNNFKINEASNWIDEIKVEYDRISYFKDILCEFIDLGFNISVNGEILNEEFKSKLGIGPKINFIKNKTDLYKGYIIIINNISALYKTNIKKIMDIKETELYLIEGLNKEGFKFTYSNLRDDIYIEIYHPDDIIDKDSYINHIFRSKHSLDIKDDLEFFQKNLGKISNIYINSLNDSILIEEDPYNKYSLDDIYDIVCKICERRNKNYNVSKETKYYSSTKPDIIVVKNNYLIQNR